MALSGRGRFIVLEGPDGSGKSVQTELLAAHLRAAGHPITQTREPGGTRLGEQIRAILLDTAPVARGPLADALLFHAARAQLLEEIVRPALERGDVVVCDRFSTSTMAYQGFGSGLDRRKLEQLETWVTGGLRPGLVILLDVPVEVGLARRGSGALEGLTRFEDASRHDRAFHERVRAGYLKMAAADPVRWRVVDATADTEVVARMVAARARAFLESSEREGVVGAGTEAEPG